MTHDPFDTLRPVGAPDPDDAEDHGPDMPEPPPTDGDPREAGPERDCASLPLNDLGNAKRFAAHFGEDLMHVPRVAWFVWDGKRWKRDDDQIETRRKAQQVSALIAREIAHIGVEPWQAAILEGEPALLEEHKALTADGKPAAGSAPAKRLAEVDDGLSRIKEIRDALKGRRQSHRRFAVTSGNSGRISAMMDEAQVALSRALEALDADPLTVNTESGAITFRVEDAGEGSSRVATWALRPHRRDDLLTKMMPLAYDPDAQAPLFEAFLRRVQPDPSMRGFLQRWLGLSLTGLQHQQLSFWYGGGANGKSVLADLIARLMGDYSASAKIESLTGRNRRSGGDATPDLVPLIGARMVRASEPEEGERLQEAKIKELTGGEPILVRSLNKDFVEATPIFKLTMSGNHKPEVRGGDDGIWRRLLLVPWEVTIPEAERDPTLGATLWEERAGIFNWLIDGLLQFLEGGLQAPEKVYAATAEYRRESDPVGQFLTDATIFTGQPGDTIRSADIVNRFNYWMIEAGLGQWKPRTISLSLSKKVDTWHHPKSGLTFSKGKASVMQFVGLRMVDAFERRYDRAPKDQSGRPLAMAEEAEA